MNIKLVELDTTKYTANALRRRIASRDTTALEITRAFLQRIEALNPTINAICTINPRAEEEAQRVDDYVAGGNQLRPLEGVPFVAKDNLDTAGLRTTLGTEHLQSRVPTQDAVSVARLKAAGAVLIGKSNTPEFAADINTTNNIFGQTRNPWDLNATPGGSSGGTGAAIAAPMPEAAPVTMAVRPAREKSAPLAMSCPFRGRSGAAAHPFPGGRKGCPGASRAPGRCHYWRSASSSSTLSIVTGVHGTW